MQYVIDTYTGLAKCMHVAIRRVVSAAVLEGTPFSIPRMRIERCF